MGINRPKRYSWLILAAVIAISALAAVKLPSLRFDYDFEAFFPNEDRELELYDQFRKKFGHDNEFVLVAPVSSRGIFRGDFLRKTERLTRQIEAVPDVKQVSSPVTMKRLDLSGLLPVYTRILHPEDPGLYPSDSAAIYGDGTLIGSFFPEDARSLSIYIKTEEGLSKERSDSLAQRLERIFYSHAFEDIHYVGRIFAQNVYLENLKREFSLFLAISFFLVVLFLVISFRSVYGVIVPVIVVLTSILWTLGLMAWLNKPIDIMSTMLPTMIFIAGVSDVVHFFSKYAEERSRLQDKGQVLVNVFRQAGVPTFFTLLTTVVGFLSLLFSSIRPVQQFGLYTSAGIAIAFLLTYSLLPAIVQLFDPPLMRTRKNSGKQMRQLFLFVMRHQKAVLVLFTVLSLTAVTGIGRIRINNILLEDLSERVKIKQDFNFFDEHYSGVRPLELQLSVKSNAHTVWDYQILKEISRIDSFIRKEYSARFILSPAGIVAEIHRANGSAPGFPDKEDFDSYAKILAEAKKNRSLSALVAKDGKDARISAKIRDIGSLKVNAHNAELMKFIAHRTDTSLISVQLTGGAHLVDRNNSYMVKNMLTGFGFSVGVISLLTLILHRSFRMVLVFIVPNLVPLLFIAGVMGFAGIELKAATALVFSIALGIATDDTIHFISRLKIERSAGKSILYALKRTFLETGKPIILTTFILIGGFISLMTSNFQSTFYFGFLICLTIVIALLADLFLLPVLLLLVYRKKK